MQNLNPNSLNGPLRESERTLLQLIRDRGPLSKAELARISGMSAQGDQSGGGVFNRVACRQWADDWLSCRFRWQHLGTPYRNE